MFGFAKRKQLAASDYRILLQAFNEMKLDCPGAAFLFARSLGECTALVMEAKSQRWPINAVIRDFVSQKSKLFGLDKGSSMLAAQSMERITRSIVEDEEQKEIENMITEIVGASEQYRELRDSDHLRPENKLQLEFLQQLELECLSDFISIQFASREIEKDSDEAQELTNQFVAVFDVMTEWEDGQLKNYLSRINDWIQY